MLSLVTDVTHTHTMADYHGYHTCAWITLYYNYYTVYAVLHGVLFGECTEIGNLIMKTRIGTS